MKKLIKEHWKDYFRSSVVTFMAGFGTELLIHLDELTMESFSDGAWLGVLFVAIRAGVRAIVQAFLEYRKR